ncbi:MAG: AAA family ATPase [Ignavibacteriae bacterium]|nr:AAA family ATPase [Ignavibacteriota bacterium]MCB9214926.1 AAA family ATPase [Ignavibacteria bacterium]
MRENSSILNPNIIRFFRECYVADNRRSVLWDIYHKSIDHRIAIEGREDLLNGFLFTIPLDPERGQEIRKAAHLYRAEKELLYASLMVVGLLRDGDEEKNICAPLLTHTAEVEEDEGGNLLLRIDLESRQINYHLLDAVRAGEVEGDIEADIGAELGTGPLTFAEIGILARFLKRWSPELDCSNLFLYPELHSERELRACVKEIEVNRVAPLRLLPYSTLLLLPKSVQMRGVLNELEQIAEGDHFSKPLHRLFSPTSIEVNRISNKSRSVRTPAVLSDAQQRALVSARENALSLLVGPPGTGKSFTIACIAMEHISRGESVLIASKMNHAVDVVGTIIEKRLGAAGMVVRAGGSHYLRELKGKLERLLSGMIVGDGDEGEPARTKEKRLRQLEKKAEQLEREFTATEKKWSRYGEWIVSEESGAVAKLKGMWGRWRAGRTRALSDILHNLEGVSLQRIDAVTDLLIKTREEKIVVVLKKHRAELQKFLSGLRARRGGRREEIFDELDYRTLFQVFPLWLTNLSDAHRSLPMPSELFDLAIIDEATQCDVASTLPILQRAKRVLITGDPKQLRHLSFLSNVQQRGLQEQYGLPDGGIYDYRSMSILDVVNSQLQSQDQVMFLDEHYRSLPQIIGFSNREFYHNRLRVMKEFPQAKAISSLTVIECSGQQEPSGVNRLEGERLLSDLLQILEDQRGNRQDAVSTIGILSPFRVQSDYLAEEIVRNVEPEMIERHDIIVGTAYTFQGEERDVMYISLAVDASSHHARFRYLHREDAFNVMVTRAKREGRIYSSISEKTLPPDTLLRKYLRYAHGADALPKSTPPRRRDHDQFVEEVSTALQQKDCHVHRGWMIAGLYLDIMVERGSLYCGLNLIGAPQTVLSLERYRMFLRAGVPVVPIPQAEWSLNPNGCIEAIESALLSSG